MRQIEGSIACLVDGLGGGIKLNGLPFAARGDGSERLQDKSTCKRELLAGHGVLIADVNVLHRHLLPRANAQCRVGTLKNAQGACQIP